MRWRRRELLWQAFRSRRDLTPLKLRLNRIPPTGVLVFCTLRNELPRLPVFLDHYRRLGAVHFLVVDNGSTDGGDRLLAEQPDVSIWRTEADYRAARYGMVWINHLLARYGRGRWCLTVDTDELLIYPHCDSRDLNALTDRLDETGARAMGALMLELFPRGRLDDPLAADAHPLTHLSWFDAGPFSAEIQPRTMALRVRGGARARALLQDAPDRAPTLNKLPLVRWHWRMAYLNSTHSLLPPPLNRSWDGPGDRRLSGVLLHTKFTPEVIAKSAEDLLRRQHFADPDAMRPYYERIIGGDGLWHEDAQHLSGDWRQLTALKLMSDGGWA